VGKSHLQRSWGKTACVQVRRTQPRVSWGRGEGPARLDRRGGVGGRGVGIGIRECARDSKSGSSSATKRFSGAAGARLGGIPRPWEARPGAERVSQWLAGSGSTLAQPWSEAG
jgi:hypothetical protein